MKFLKRHLNSKAILLAGVMLFPLILFAHNINYSMENSPANDVMLYYSLLGIKHIIPLGLDHILFIAGLCLLGSNLRSILLQATIFTIAHSITLALSLKNIINLPGEIIEPFISLSILFVAIENMVSNKLKAWRIAIIFIFGLIHGMGFASALNEIGLPPGKFLLSVFSFNLGVEIGQVAVIVAVYTILITPWRTKTWYRRLILAPASCCIAAAALYWTFERVSI